MGYKYHKCLKQKKRVMDSKEFKILGARKIIGSCYVQVKKGKLVKVFDCYASVKTTEDIFFIDDGIDINTYTTDIVIEKGDE